MDKLAARVEVMMDGQAELMLGPWQIGKITACVKDHGG